MGVQIYRSHRSIEFTLTIEGEQYLVAIAMTMHHKEQLFRTQKGISKIGSSLSIPYIVKTVRLTPYATPAHHILAKAAILKIPSGISLSSHLEHGGDILSVVNEFQNEFSKLGAALSKLHTDDRSGEHIYMGSLHEDRLLVTNSGGYGFVDSMNRVVIETTYLWADDFREGRAEVESSAGFGLIDTDGEVVIPAIYDSLSYNSNSGITAARLDGKWAYFSYRGEQLTEPTTTYPNEDITLSEIAALQGALPHRL